MILIIISFSLGVAVSSLYWSTQFMKANGKIMRDLSRKDWLRSK